MTVVDVVIPTVGRASLGALLTSLAPERDRLGGRVLVVDDRPGGRHLPVPAWAEVVRGRVRGPAAARNDGPGPRARGGSRSWTTTSR